MAKDLKEGMFLQKDYLKRGDVLERLKMIIPFFMYDFQLIFASL